MRTQPILAISLALLSCTVLVPAASAAQITVQVGPPPPARYEAAPAPRRGMVWSPGHWEWRHQRYAWAPGRWIKARPGYVYQQPAWREHHGRWNQEGGHWRRKDRDGDGVPNRYDSRPNNPYRY